MTIAQFGDLLFYLPLYIARDKGLFAKHGIDAKIVSTGGDDKTFASVISGSAEFGVADPTFVAIAGERGERRGRVVALLIDGVPDYGVSLSGAAPAVRRPADLAGKTVATAPAPSTAYALMRRMYESAKLRPAIYQVAASGLVPALQNGRADYALLIEPYVSSVVRNRGRVVFSLPDCYRRFALTGVTTTDRLIAKDPGLVNGVTAALTEGVKLFYDQPDVALRIARERFPNESVDDLRQGNDRHRRDAIYPRSLSTTEAAWSEAIQLRKETGDLREPAPLAAYVDNRFTERAVP